MPGGRGKIRPSDGKQFSSSYQPKETWTEEEAIKLGNDMINWLREKDDEGEDKGNIFYEEFLLIENNYYPSLIAYLRDKFTSFSKLLEKAKKIQEIKLTKYGVGDRLNATMTKFVLINNHDWKDKQEVEHSGETTQTVTIFQLPDNGRDTGNT